MIDANFGSKDQSNFCNMSMVLYIRMVVKQFGSRVAQLVGGAKVGLGGGKE